MKPTENNDLYFNFAGLLQNSFGATRDYTVEQPELALDEDARARNLAGTVRLLRINRGILAAGNVTADVVLECSRCLIPFERRVRAEFEEEFRPSVDVNSGAPIDTLLEGEDEDDFFNISANHILDLSEATRQAILVSLPPYPVCRPDCAGLCPECGADLNIENCGHARYQPDHRMSALASLLDEIDDPKIEDIRSK